MENRWTLFIPSITVLLERQTISILIQIVDDMQSIRVQQSVHFPIRAQDLNYFILQSTYYRLQEVRWNHYSSSNLHKTNSFPLVSKEVGSSYPIRSSSDGVGSIKRRDRPFDRNNHDYYSKMDYQHQYQYRDEQQRIESLLRKMMAALHPTLLFIPPQCTMILQSIVLQLVNGEQMITDCRVEQVYVHYTSDYPILQVYTTIERVEMVALHPTSNNPLTLFPFEGNGKEQMLSPQPLIQVTINLEVGALITLHSVVLSVAPLRLQFSISALRALIDFFNPSNSRSSSFHPSSSPHSSSNTSSNPYSSSSIRLIHLRLNPIRVYCALCPTTQVEYALIPFTLHPITLRERICSVKHIFKLLQGKLLMDLLSKSSQHWNQASAVVANAMGYSKLVSLLRRPIQLPGQLLKHRKKREEEKRIQQLLGKRAHLVNPKACVCEEWDVLQCTEESIPSFSNPLFDQLLQMNQPPNEQEDDDKFIQ